MQNVRRLINQGVHFNRNIIEIPVPNKNMERIKRKGIFEHNTENKVSFKATLV